jgi:hypothetical protein
MKNLRISSNSAMLIAIGRIQQAWRSKLARKKYHQYRHLRIIKFAAKRYLARQKRNNLLQNHRRLEDYSSSVVGRGNQWKTWKTWKLWKKYHRAYLGLMRVMHAAYLCKIRVRMTKWKKWYTWKIRNLIRPAVQIQSLIRMGLVKRQELHYYKWRRGMLAIQGLARRKPLREQYHIDIFYYRKAKRIQVGGLIVMV